MDNKKMSPEGEKTFNKTQKGLVIGTIVAGIATIGIWVKLYIMSK